MTREQAQAVAEDANGTCQSANDLAEKHGLTVDQVNEACVDNEIEMCEVCGWWCEVSEMHETSNGSACEDCRE